MTVYKCGAVQFAKAVSLTCHLLQVCEVLFSKTMKYDELYTALTSLLAAGSQFDTLRRKENKNVTALVRLCCCNVDCIEE